MIFRKRNKKSGSSFVEYGIVLALASVIFMSMNTYVKRGIQGRIKDMTDHFISDEQVVKPDPGNIESTGKTTTIDKSALTVNGHRGSRWEINYIDTKNTHAESESKDYDSSWNGK